MTEYTDRIFSRHLGNDRLVWIIPPRDPQARALTIFLDAEFYRERIGAVALLQDLVSRREIGDSWFVFVSVRTFETRWIECPCYPPFPRFITEELLPRLERYFPELRQVQQRTLVGLSYTGLAAAFVAKEAPGLFQCVISQSGSFWWNDCWLTQACRKSGLSAGTRFYLDVGNQETAENVRHLDVLQVVSQVAGVRGFRDELIRQGVAVEYREFDGGHDFLCWKKMLPGALQWALPNQLLELAQPVASSR